jgi:hypothetical protein
MNNKFNSNEYFRITFFIYYTLISAQVLFAAVILIITSGRETDFKFEEYAIYFIIGVSLFIVWGIFGGKYLFSTKLNLAKKEKSLFDKLSSYRTALIIKYAVLEGPAIFSIISYLLTGNILFIILAGLIIIFFLFMKPTKDKLIIELELNSSEKEIIDDPAGIIS